MIEDFLWIRYQIMVSGMFFGSCFSVTIFSESCIQSSLQQRDLVNYYKNRDY